MQEYIQIELNKKINNIYIRKGRWLLLLPVLTLLAIGIWTDTSSGLPAKTNTILLLLYLLIYGSAIFLYCQYLIPRYFKQNRQLKFWAYLVAGVLTVPFISLLIQYITWLLTGTGGVSPLTPEAYGRELRDTLVTFMALSFFLYLIEAAEGRNIYKAIRIEAIAHQRVEQGLIRTRMDPEFIMRSLDGIARLSENQDRHAPDAVISFADVLRYRLYNNEVQVPLAVELMHLKSLCDFQNMLTEQPDACVLRTMGDSTGKWLPPLLLINIAEIVLRTNDASGRWSVFMYILIEDREINLVIELPYASTEPMKAFDNIIATANYMLDAACIFTKERNEETLSLSICIPVKNSTA